LSRFLRVSDNKNRTLASRALFDVLHLPTPNIHIRDTLLLQANQTCLACDPTALREDLPQRR
jgi:hypothetical protein